MILFDLLHEIQPPFPHFLTFHVDHYLAIGLSFTTTSPGKLCLSDKGCLVIFYQKATVFFLRSLTRKKFGYEFTVLICLTLKATVYYDDIYAFVSSLGTQNEEGCAYVLSHSFEADKTHTSVLTGSDFPVVDQITHNSHKHQPLLGSFILYLKEIL